MRDDRKIVCPECGKVVGEYVLDMVMSSPLGSIPCYDSKVDYRKAAHIGIGKGKFGYGPLCRKCAKHIFSEGVAYKVLIWYVKDWMSVNWGINHSCYFASRKDAEEAVANYNRRDATNRAKIEEVKF